MADGFIVRKGGVTVDITAAPSINFVSKTFDSITFTITNNDALTADIFWEIGDSTPDANTFLLAGGATSSNQVASGLDAEETYTIFAFANAEGKAGSQTTSQVRTTPVEPPPVYTAATGGTTLEYDDGGTRYRSHTFTSDGTFTVTTAGNVNRNLVDYLIIAGGGGGGRGRAATGAGSGGGAGGYRTTNGTSGGLNPTTEPKVAVTETSYPVVVGGGGGGASAGVSSSVFSVISVGGGAGVDGPAIGGFGGSGGGGGGGNNDSGIGTTGQGFKGGKQSGAAPCGGGGGAGGQGIDINTGNNGVGSAGGPGLANLLRTGSNETRAGGGGGGSYNSGGSSAGGAGGGGNGRGSGIAGNNGAATTGSGAGGGGGADSASSGRGSGGSGIVVIRYEIPPSV